MELLPPNPSAATEACPACRHLDFEPGLVGDLYLCDVLVLARKDCVLCKIFKSVANVFSIPGTEPFYFKLQRFTFPPTSRPPLKFTINNVKNNVKNRGNLPDDDFRWHLPNFKGQELFQIYTDDESTSEPWLHLAYDIHSPVLSSIDDISQQATSWLAYCAKSHTGTCPAFSQKLPTRLIAVGSLIKDPFLYTSTPNEYGSYAALSYCWGGSQAFSTKLATIKAYENGLDLEKLPATIRDAVLLTRELGIKYLWVDSLCIIQDSTSDWEQESAQMCLVYSNSTITYAAIDSQSSESGLFIGGHGYHFQRLPGLEYPVYLRSERHMVISTTRNDENFRDRESSTSLPGISFRALHERGWTFQEIKLSPRIIWFGADEISWSCLCGTACECKCERKITPSSINFSGTDLWHPLGKIALVEKGGREQRFFERRGSTITKDWNVIWGDLVNGFSSRRLSCWKDRLPAISGLASIIQQHLGSDYMSGMWHNDTFLDQLLWRVSSALSSDELQELSYPSKDMLCAYAPSWSWASTHAGAHIHYQMHPKNNEAFPLWKLRSVDYRTSTTNRFGPGQGSVTVQSWITQVKPYDNVEYLVFPYYNIKWSQHIYLDIPRSPLGGDGAVETTNRYFFDSRKGEDYLDICVAGNLHFVFAFVKVISNEGKFWQVTGLILQKLSKDIQVEGQKETNRYRRVGIAELCIIQTDGTRASDLIYQWNDRGFWDKLASQEILTIV